MKTKEKIVDKSNYDKSNLHERIKSFVLGEIKVEWDNPELDNLRTDVEGFVDILHARIDGFSTKIPHKWDITTTKISVEITAMYMENAIEEFKKRYEGEHDFLYVHKGNMYVK